MVLSRRFGQVIATLSMVTCVGCGHPSSPAPVQPVQPAQETHPEPTARADSSAPPTAAEGEQLFQYKGCVSCHSVDGTPRVGPPLNGYLGRELSLADGTRVVGSEARLRASLDKPEPLKDYPVAMPVYGDQLDARTRQAITAYVASLP